MPVLVVGSVAIDSIESPEGSAPEVLGGSATHFSLAASLFAPVQLVGVIGHDFPESYLDVLRERDVDLAGLELQDGSSFRWSGRYVGAMAQAETLSVELNVFGSFDPHVPGSFRGARHVFLANGSPEVQRKVLDQVEPGAFCLLDTMNLWIDIARDGLVDVLRRVDALVINDEEIRMLTGEANLIAAGREGLNMGPKAVIVKKGEHGALLFHGDDVFAAPAYPVEKLVDPTGAGDSFAGGVMGSLAAQGEGMPSVQAFRQAVAVGTVTASFNVQGFGVEGIRSVTLADVAARYDRYRQMLALEEAAPLFAATTPPR